MTYEVNGIPSECQSVWMQIWPDILSSLIFSQSVHKSYQQRTLAGRELRVVYFVKRFQIQANTFVWETVKCSVKQDTYISLDEALMRKMCEYDLKIKVALEWLLYHCWNSLHSWLWNPFHSVYLQTGTLANNEDLDVCKAKNKSSWQKCFIILKKIHNELFHTYSVFCQHAW